VDIKAAYATVRGPANWLFCIGIISFVPSGIAAVSTLIQFLFGRLEEVGMVFTVCIAASSFLIILGGQRMKRLESYRLCKAAAILAVIPLSTGCLYPFSLFAGIWALRVLKRKEIVAAFEAKQRELSNVMEKSKANPS